MKITSEIKVDENGNVLSIKGNTLSFTNELKQILQPMETLQQKEQRLLKELQQVKQQIEDSKIKEGDWCIFWNHDKSKSIIAKFQGSKFACITSGDYFLNCQKITDLYLLKRLNKLS